MPPVPPRRPQPPARVQPQAKRVQPLARGARKELAAFAEAPDPLAGVQYTGNLEADSAAELGAIEQGFRARMANEQDRVNNELDTERWFCVVFETRDQRDDFLAKAKLAPPGDNKYLDYRDVAAALGIDVIDSGRKYRPEPRIDAKLAALAKPVDYRK